MSHIKTCSRCLASLPRAEWAKRRGSVSESEAASDQAPPVTPGIAGDDHDSGSAPGSGADE